MVKSYYRRVIALDFLPISVCVLALVTTMVTATRHPLLFQSRCAQVNLTVPRALAAMRNTTSH